MDHSNSFKSSKTIYNSFGWLYLLFKKDILLPFEKVGAVFIIVKLFCRSPRKQFLHPFGCVLLAPPISTVLKASWQAYPLLYGHLIFKVQRVRCITPFHRFFFDLFTCLKKYPSICTNRERVKYRVF